MKNTDFFEKVQTVIALQYSDSNFNVTALHKTLGLTRAGLFRKLMQRGYPSAQTLIRAYRIEKAKEFLLQDNEMSIAQVGYQCGFKDPNFFSRAFKKEVGCTPSVFKKNGGNF